jgi:hypothetical protein
VFNVTNRSQKYVFQRKGKHRFETLPQYGYRGFVNRLVQVAFVDVPAGERQDAVAKDRRRAVGLGFARETWAQCDQKCFGKATKMIQKNSPNTVPFYVRRTRASICPVVEQSL